MERKPFTILLVDDRAENLMSLEDMLEEESRIFLKARSGNEALKLTLKNENIGLIMLDVQMPGMDGFEVAELLKSNAKTKDISIIFVTAISKEEQYVMKGYGQGAVDYLQKPLDVNVTKAKVKVFEQLYFYQHELKETIKQKDKINGHLERFMYVVAHDLKSPLSGIVGLLSLMSYDERIMSHDDLKQYMTLILKASNHLSEMIRSILEYSSQEDVEQTKETVDVHALVSDIARLLFPPEHVSITIKGTLPVIKTKKFKLQQVFQNLMSNAIKYSNKQRGRIEVGCEDDGDFYKFYVKDNGPGIKKDDEARIFYLFETGDNKSNSKTDNSTGVGLNITKLLVEEQGGKITVKSTPGEGSCFYFQWCK